MSLRTSSGGATAGLLSVVAAILWVGFARQPVLGTFADDSVSYLVMAQVFSPWHAASAPVVAVFPHEAFHPPLFPLFLALTGASHDVALAHAACALLLAACLFLVYRVAQLWLGTALLGVLAAVAVLLLPASWIQVRGVLSEPLFCLLLLAVVAVLEVPATRARLGVLAVLLALLALTRTIGLAVAAAYGFWALTRSGGWRERVKGLSPVLAPAIAYAAWIVLRPAVHDVNAGAAADRFSELLTAGPGALGTFADGIARQAVAMGEAWTGGLMLFWVEGSVARPAVAALVGTLALTGMAMRRHRPDAWMSAAYLAVYLLWPFYDQMTRFLFPLLPLLVVYAFVPLARLGARWSRPVLPGVVLFLVVASLAVPALGFIHQRARSGTPHADIVDWYRTPDLAAARARAQVHLDLAADMETIRRATPPDARVMWVAPAYVALLAGRHAVPAPSARVAPEEYRRQVAASGATHVYLSTFHPRDTVREDAWRVGSVALAGAEVVAQRPRSASGGLGSVLLRLR